MAEAAILPFPGVRLAFIAELEPCFCARCEALARRDGARQLRAPIRILNETGTPAAVTAGAPCPPARENIDDR